MEAACKIAGSCGGCSYLNMEYAAQKKKKEKEVEQILSGLCKVRPILGMDDPWHYRNKVSAAFQRRRDGRIVSGIYEAGTHRVLPVESCLIEDQDADAIIGTIRSLIPSFRIRVYDEDTGYGLLRHVMIRKAHATGQILVILVVADPVFPSKNNFVKALRKAHPEITSIVLNVNSRQTSMVLGDRNIVLYGKGFIEDVLCGKRFQLSPQSFYQVNSLQTEVLYGKALELAGLSGKETVLDAYCGIGTIGITASDKAERVVGVELNPEAVRDAAANARLNKIGNIRFFCRDATEFLVDMAARGEKMDVLFMDPPRSGSTEAFIRAAASMGPERIVYISCNPVTMARDMKVFRGLHYQAKEAWPVDMFPWTKEIEVAALLTRK